MGQRMQMPGEEPQPSGCTGCGCKSVLSVGCLAVVICVAVFVILSYYNVMGLMKSSALFEQAMEQIQASAEVAEALGSPIKGGTPRAGRYEVDGSVSKAEATLPVQGPKGKGTVHVAATKIEETWRFTTLELTVEGSGSVIDLTPAVAEAPPSSPTAPTGQRAQRPGRPPARRPGQTLALPPAAPEPKVKVPEVSRDTGRTASAVRAKVSPGTEPGETQTFEGGEFAWIPPGTFRMGSKLSPGELAELYNDDPRTFQYEVPRHRVTISRGLWMATKEVTNGEFEQFVNATGHVTDTEKEGLAFGYLLLSPRPGESGYRWQWGKAYGMSWRNPDGHITRETLVPRPMTRPDYFPFSSDRERVRRRWVFEQGVQTIAPRWEPRRSYPVVAVGWKDAIAYCEWLSQKTGETYRLPTEAEWEYACRAGSDTQFQWGDNPDEGIDRLNAADRTSDREFKWAERKFNFTDGHMYVAPAGSYKPNAWGLHNMHGNVAEWCSDLFGDYSAEHVTDPTGPAKVHKLIHRVARGGAWCIPPQACRSAFRRRSFNPGGSLGENQVGFRLVRPVNP